MCTVYFQFPKNELDFIRSSISIVDTNYNVIRPSCKHYAGIMIVTIDDDFKKDSQLNEIRDLLVNENIPFDMTITHNELCPSGYYEASRNNKFESLYIRYNEIPIISASYLKDVVDEAMKQKISLKSVIDMVIKESQPIESIEEASIKYMCDF